jgi:hypothetical protein
MKSLVAAISVMSGVLIAGLGTLPLSSQVPQGPLPSQDTPPLTEQQKCSTLPTPKVETQGPGTETPSERSPDFGGADCPPPTTDRIVPITPPPGGQMPAVSAPERSDSRPDVHAR